MQGSPTIAAFLQVFDTFLHKLGLNIWVKVLVKQLVSSHIQAAVMFCLSLGVFKVSSLFMFMNHNSKSSYPFSHEEVPTPHPVFVFNMKKIKTN